MKRPVDRRWTGYKNRAAGEFGETLVEAHLVRAGYKMVEKVNTPWKVIWRNGRPAQAFPVKKVSGDFRAVESMTGRSVLVEVKTKDADTLPWSAFQPHQIESLDAHWRASGLSLVAWVREGVVKIYEWPIAGFGPRKGLSCP